MAYDGSLYGGLAGRFLIALYFVAWPPSVGAYLQVYGLAGNRIWQNYRLDGWHYRKAGEKDTQ